MTTLSWLLYFADIADNVRSLFSGWVIFPIVFYLFAQVVWVVYRFEQKNDSNTDESLLKYGDSLLSTVRKLTIAIVIATAITHSFVPEKKTIYMIAGVEFTNTIITSDSNKALLDKIHKVVNKELDQLLEGK